MTLAIAVHGGAGDIPDSLRPDHEQGITAALQAGKYVLLNGGSAIDAVVEAVKVLEELAAFNAGYGSVLNKQGFVEMDAGIMDGTTLDFGAVAAIQNIKHPIVAAYTILATPHVLFAKSDAERLALNAGAEAIDGKDLITPRRLKQWQEGELELKVDSGLADTVGAVALDAQGRIAAATSTGGMSGKPVGRIGDSPLPGGGFYADSDVGGCSTTGWGESIARVLLARRAVEGLERGLTAQEAAENAVAFLGRRIVGGEGGLILLGNDGSIGAAFNSKRMTHAFWNDTENTDHIVA